MFDIRGKGGAELRNMEQVSCLIHKVKTKTKSYITRRDFYGNFPDIKLCLCIYALNVRIFSTNSSLILVRTSFKQINKISSLPNVRRFDPDVSESDYNDTLIICEYELRSPALHEICVFQPGWHSVKP